MFERTMKRSSCWIAKRVKTKRRNGWKSEQLNGKTFLQTIKLSSWWTAGKLVNNMRLNGWKSEMLNGYMFKRNIKIMRFLINW